MPRYSAKKLCRSRSRDERKPLALEFFSRCRGCSIPTHVAIDIWTQMCKFTSYSFCRAHAASYGLLAWMNCWLKAHYPREFWVAALNNNQGMYARWVYVEAIKQAGITILPPSVNESNDAFSLEGTGIRCGLACVAGLKVSTRTAIYAARPFRNFLDLTHRVAIAIHEQRALIRSGALDFCELNRPQMLALTARRRPPIELRHSMPGLFDYDDAEAPIPRMEPFSPKQRFVDEWQSLGVSIGEHPITHAAGRPGNEECVSPLTMPMEGRHVKMRGMLAASRRITCDDGRHMCFLTLSDEGGIFEVTVQPAIYAQYKYILAGNHSFLTVNGIVISGDDSLSLEAEEIVSLSLGSGQPVF